MNINEGALCHLHFNHYRMILSEAPVLLPIKYHRHFEPLQLMIHTHYRTCLCIYFPVFIHRERFPVMTKMQLEHDVDQIY